MAVDVMTAPKFEARAPKALFGARIAGPLGGTSSTLFSYDVAANGKRFLINTAKHRAGRFRFRAHHRSIELDCVD